MSTNTDEPIACLKYEIFKNVSIYLVYFLFKTSLVLNMVKFNNGI